MRGRTTLAILVAGAVCFSSSMAAAGPAKAKRIAMAARYLVSQQRDDGSIPGIGDPIWTADAIVALVAARRAPKSIARALHYLETNADEWDTVGERAKVTLALVAAGRDPEEFASRDLVDELEATQQSDGRYGADTSVFSHALTMLALEGAQASATLSDAGAWLVGAQCRNGGWQTIGPATPAEDDHCSFGYPDIDEANADTTSLAIQALSGLEVPVEPAHDPFAFLDTMWDEANGGWSYDRPDSLHSNFTSHAANANSTAMVLQAYAAADRALPPGALDALIGLQARLCGKSAGSFFYTWTDDDGDGTYERSSGDRLAATIAALPGLLRAPLPQPSQEVFRPAPRAVAC